jgi:hypothetical protein
VRRNRHIIAVNDQIIRILQQHGASNRQHRHRKLESNGIMRTVLATGTAVPAFVRILNHRYSIFHVDDVERAVESAKLATVALPFVDDGGHERISQLW